MMVLASGWKPPRKGGLGEDLVDEQRADGSGDPLAAAARNAGGLDVAFRKLRRERPELRQEGALRIALDPDVGRRKETAVPVEDRRLDCHRTDIDAEKEFRAHDPAFANELIIG